MSASFKDVLVQTANAGSWRYYCGAEPDFVKATQFLQDYLKQSGKFSAQIMSDLKQLEIQENDSRRIMHTQNTFLLGFYIYNKCAIIKKSINRVLRGLSTEIPTYSFKYIWFLICFFHDLAYCFELSHKNDIDIEKCLKEKHLSHLTGVPVIFRSSYKAYFKYRYNGSGGGKACVDHGIYGGLRYYQELKAIRTSNERCDSRHSWARGLNRIYNYCSWIILGHNIWYAYTEEKAQLYRSYGLSELIINPHCFKVRIDRHPLLFLFQIVDSIEPAKIDLSLLDAIDIDIHEDKLMIRLRQPEDSLSQRYISKYSGPDSTDYWLTPTQVHQDKLIMSLSQH